MNQDRAAPPVNSLSLAQSSEAAGFKTKVIDKAEMTAADIRNYVTGMIDLPRALLTTDEYAGYNGLNKIVTHRRINEITYRHNARQTDNAFDRLLHLAVTP